MSEKKFRRDSNKNERFAVYFFLLKNSIERTLSYLAIADSGRKFNIDRKTVLRFRDLAKSADTPKAIPTAYQKNYKNCARKPISNEQSLCAIGEVL